MDRSSEARALRQVNGRTRLVVDLSEPLGLIESLSSRLEDEVDGLSNAIDALSNDIGELEVGFGTLETWGAATDPKIRTLQEFDLVFNDDLRNLHDEIDAVAEIALNARATLSNDISDLIGTRLYPNDGLQRIGRLDAPWLEGHFGTVFADEMCVSHPEGGGRRVMYERFKISYNDLVNKPEVLQDEQGPPGPSTEDLGYLPPTPLTSALERGYQYISNTAPDAGYEVFRLSGDGGVLFTNALFLLTISLNVRKGVVTKYQIGAGLRVPSAARLERDLLR
jgi:hypothetical protein